MGYWGYQSWENDAAADWYDQYPEAARTPAVLDEALRLPLENIDEIRAAAFSLFSQSRTCPHQPALVELAIGRLSEAMEEGIFQNPHFISAIMSEVQQLRALQELLGNRQSE